MKLADVLLNPAIIETLRREDIPELRAELTAIDTRLLAHLLTADDSSQTAGDQLLGVTETANRLGVSLDYLYRNHRRLPFTRHAGRKLLFSSRGIDEFIAQKKTL